MVSSICAPVVPYQGTRGIDAWGAGGFAAPRSKPGPDGKRIKYEHRGIDFLGQPGDACVASLDAVVDLLNIAYPDDPLTPDKESDLRSIHLKGINAWDGILVKLLYAMPSVLLGDRVARGGPIATVQDRAAFAHEAALYHADLPVGPMLNHVHLEVYILENGLWALKDPAAYLVVPPCEV